MQYPKGDSDETLAFDSAGTDFHVVYRERGVGV